MMTKDLELFLTYFRNKIEPLWSRDTALREDNEQYGPFISRGQGVVTSLLLLQEISEAFPGTKTRLKIGSVTDISSQSLIPNHGWITENPLEDYPGEIVVDDNPSVDSVVSKVKELISVE